MSRTKKIAILAIVIMVLTMLPVQMFAAADSNRLAGEGREATALAIAGDGWTSANTVIVAPADQANLVDALAVAPLAGQENAPILLTFKDKLNADVKAKISALGAKKVYVVGAISDAVKNEIAGLSGVSVEVLKGSSRWETANAINAKLTSPAGTFVVGYDAIADALSAASFAAKNKYAIVLANVDGTVDSAKLVGTTKYIVGGTAKVKDIAGITRLSGADRFATNKAVAEALSFTYGKVYVANGLSLVDALAVAPLAAKSGAFVALTNGTSVEASSVIAGKATAATQYIAVGGTSAVSDAARDAAKGTAAATEFKVVDVTTNGLSSILVTFSGEVDEDSAEAIANYVLAGDTLTTNNNGTATDAKAEMLSDKKTVEIVLDTNKNQLDSKTFEVKANRILASNKQSAAASFVKTLSFQDNEAPKLDTVEATGAKKLSVVFSEPVKNSAVAGNYNTWKINGVAISSYGLSAVTMVGDSGAGDWCSEIEFTFTNPLPAGNNTLKTAKGSTTGFWRDPAGYVLSEETASFTVETVTGAPKVTEVTYDGGGTVYVTFDRAMLDDAATSQGAVRFQNYAINNNTVNNGLSAAAFKSRTGDKVVKLTPTAGTVKSGANFLVIDNTVEDAWGNRLDASTDVRVSFTAESDKTKPTVSSVTALDSKTLRVRFSEKVSNTYVRNTANWEIKKSDGAVLALGTVARPDGAVTDNDTWDMTWANATLTSTGYTLTLKNIPDLAATPNTMDNFTTTFDGYDDVKPTVTKATLAAASATGGTVAVFFDEKMDTSTTTNAANYNYVGSNGTYYSLPEGTTLTADATGKVVNIKFPTSYTVYRTGTAAGAHLSSKYAVDMIMISNVKDAAGNVLKSVSETENIVAPAASIAITQSSVVISETGTDQLKVVFTLDQELTTFVAADFTVAGVAPDSGSVVGKTVTLNYTTYANVNTVKGAGANAILKTVGGPASTAAGGETLVDTSGLTGAFVYDDQIAPKLLSVTASATQVFLGFSEAIDDTILGLYDDDFTITTDGAVRTVSSATVSGAYVIYTISGGVGAANTVVVAKAQEAKIDIRDKKEATSRDASAPASKGDYNKYVPSSGDVSGRTCDPDGNPAYNYAP